MPQPDSPPIHKADKTRDRIIGAAEKLFAERGFRAMTLREVTRDAQVNLAAVNYHFGSKRDLMRAVIHNRFEPINAARLRRLDALVAKHAPDAIPLRDIFCALFHPLFEAAGKKGNADALLMQLIGRAVTEPAEFMRAMHREFFAELCRRFMTEVQRSCPQLDDSEIHYRFFFAVSTMIGSLVEKSRFEYISGDELAGDQLDLVVRHLIDFVVAGFEQSPHDPGKK